VSPDEAKEFTAIERTMGKRVPRRELKGYVATAEVRHANGDASHSGASGGRRDGRRGHDGDRRRDDRGHDRRPDGRPSANGHARTGQSRAAGSGHGHTPATPSQGGQVRTPEATHGRRPRSGALDRRSRKRM
jgi:hypothetical protein